MTDSVLQVGVKAIVRDAHGKLLLLKRAKPFPKEDFCRWDIPGGRIDAREHQEDALRRELQEETGLSLTSIDSVVAVQDILRNNDLHVVRITYAVTASGTPQLSDEHTEYAWFAPAEIPPALTDLYLMDALESSGWL